MTENEVIALGDYCASLMAQESFNRLYDECHAELYREFLATQFTERDKREHVFAQVWGLQRFLAKMGTYVEHARTLREANEAPATIDQFETDSL